MAATSAFLPQRDHQHRDHLPLARVKRQRPSDWVARCVAPWAHHFIWRDLRKSHAERDQDYVMLQVTFHGHVQIRLCFRTLKCNCVRVWLKPQALCPDHLVTISLFGSGVSPQLVITMIDQEVIGRPALLNPRRD